MDGLLDGKTVFYHFCESARDWVLWAWIDNLLEAGSLRVWGGEGREDVGNDTAEWGISRIKKSARICLYSKLGVVLELLQGR